MRRSIDSTTEEAANTYADLQIYMPWLSDHIDAMKSPVTLDLSVLDVLVLDMAAAASIPWALDLDMPSVIDRLAHIQSQLRVELVAHGLPYDAHPKP